MEPSAGLDMETVGGGMSKTSSTILTVALGAAGNACRRRSRLDGQHDGFVAAIDGVRNRLHGNIHGEIAGLQSEGRSADGSVVNAVGGGAGDVHGDGERVSGIAVADEGNGAAGGAY